jgi:hypothetical protein
MSPGPGMGNYTIMGHHLIMTPKLQKKISKQEEQRRVVLPPKRKAKHNNRTIF